MLLKLPILIVFEFWGASGDSNSMESVPDLQKSMYKVIDGYPCVRLLNLSGPIGCSSKFYLNFLTQNPLIFFAFKSNQIVAFLLRFLNSQILEDKWLWPRL